MSNSNQLQLKQLVAQAAIEYIPHNSIIGIGTGSTVNCFIEKLVAAKIPLKGAVSSSIASSKLLEQANIKLFDANQVDSLAIYVDGADEIDPQGYMVKGGGGALTREKITAAKAQQFICIADQSKWVEQLGNFPIPVEIVPMACSYLQQRFNQLGGNAKLRLNASNQPVITDNGMQLLDVHNLSIANPLEFEQQVSQWPGVLTVGIFAQQKANICLLATQQGVVTKVF